MNSLLTMLIDYNKTVLTVSIYLSLFTKIMFQKMWKIPLFFFHLLHAHKALIFLPSKLPSNTLDENAQVDENSRTSSS